MNTSQQFEAAAAAGRSSANAGRQYSATSAVTRPKTSTVKASSLTKDSIVDSQFFAPKSDFAALLRAAINGCMKSRGATIALTPKDAKLSLSYMFWL